MKKYWVNMFSTGDPNSADVPAWTPVGSATDMHVMVFKSEFLASNGAKLDPCLQTSPCVAEPAYNYRKVYADLMNNAEVTAPTSLPTCGTTADPPDGGYTHETVAHATTSCPASCPVCPSGRRSTLFGAPAARPAGCPAC